MKTKEWITIVIVVIVVAVLASLITSSITGDVIKVQNVSIGTEIYTKGEVDNLISSLQTQITSVSQSLTNHLGTGGTIACSSNTACGTSGTTSSCINATYSCSTTVLFSCVNAGTTQSYCANNTNINCTTCSGNTRCSNGVCSAVSNPTPTCTDTDGGVVNNRKGIVNGIYTDSCYYSVPGGAAYQPNFSGIGIIEYYCKSGYPENNNTICPSKQCYDGACK